MMLSLLSRNGGGPARVAVQRRAFCACVSFREKPLPPRIVIPETDITESFLKGTGPGGQKINKTSSAVQLKHLPTGIVVKCQDTRSREQNRRTARRLLGERLEELEKGPLSRTAIKAGRAHKKKASADKKARRKYRKLEAAKTGMDVQRQQQEEVPQQQQEEEEEQDSSTEGGIEEGRPDILRPAHHNKPSKETHADKVG